MNSKTISLAVLFLFLSVASFAQAGFDLLPPPTLSSDSSFTTVSSVDDSHLPFLKGLDFNLTTGSNFTYSKTFGSYTGFYISPSWTYNLSPRFNIKAGAVFDYSYMNSLPKGLVPYNETYGLKKNSPGVLIYAEGTYSVSTKLTLSGLAYKRMGNSPYLLMNPAATNYNIQGMSFGIDYKVFEGLTVGAQVNYRSNPGPFFPGYRNNSYIDNYFW